MISRRMYLSFVFLFLIIFILFLSIGVTSDLLADRYTNQRLVSNSSSAINRIIPLQSLNEETKNFKKFSENPLAAIISETENDADILIEWCQLNKYRYRLYKTPPSAGEASTFSILLFGNINLKTNGPLLAAYAETGIPMIFSQPPEFDVLASDPKLMDFFGISVCINPQLPVSGVKIFPGFFLGGERIYKAGDDYGTKENAFNPVPYYTLRAGYEVFATALLEDQTGIRNEELPPLLWRTYTSVSFVFVINTNLFSGKAALGVITAFLSDMYESYLYPVVNAQTIAVVNFPLFSDENSDVIRKRYSYDTSALTRSILWPNVLRILDNFGGKVSLFMAPELNRGSINKHLTDDVKMYFKGVNKKSGVIALSIDSLLHSSLSERLGSAKSFFSSVVPEYQFTALYAGAYSSEEITTHVIAETQGIIRNLTLVLTPLNTEKRLFSVTDSGILTVQSTHDGFTHQYQDDALILSIETALGVNTQIVDFSRVYYPVGDEDDWSKLSNLWSSGITYFRDFTAFGKTDIYEMEDRVRNFLTMNYTYKHSGDKIEVVIDNFQSSTWFVLRIHNWNVDHIQNGKVKKISDNAWLIQADAPIVSIYLNKVGIADLPK